MILFRLIIARKIVLVFFESEKIMRIGSSVTGCSSLMRYHPETWTSQIMFWNSLLRQSTHRA